MEKIFFSPHAEDKVFQYYWDSYYPDLSSRANFKLGHLHSLELLCGLYVEYHEMSSLIKKHGKTYETEGRFGLQIKQRPEVDMKAKACAEIRQLTKQLGILLEKDTPNPAPKKKNAWADDSGSDGDDSRSDDGTEGL